MTPSRSSIVRSSAAAASEKPIRVGIIADTHGLLRRAAVAELRGTDLIVHCGDVGGPETLAELQALARTIAVRGNEDRGRWARGLLEMELIVVGRALLCAVHDLHELHIDPMAKDVAAVLHGHSHIPSVRRADGVLFVNPGSAGPARFRLPASMAELLIDGLVVSARLIPLDGE